VIDGSGDPAAPNRARFGCLLEVLVSQNSQFAGLAPNPRRFPTLPASRGCAAAELNVIERFLAERGATHCPDMG
jgi:hypothetical protein